MPEGWAVVMPEGWAVRVIVVGTVNGPPDPGLPRVLPVRVSDWTVSVLDRSPDWVADWLSV